MKTALLSLVFAAASFASGPAIVTAEWGAIHVVEQPETNHLGLIIGAYDWDVTAYRVSVSCNGAKPTVIVADRQYEWFGMTGVELPIVPAQRNQCSITVQPLRDHADAARVAI